MGIESTHFKGVKLEDLSQLEKLFEVNITIYSHPEQSEDDEVKTLSNIIASLLHRSHLNYDSTLYLNL